MLTTTKSESDITSLAASSPPRSPPKRGGAAGSAAAAYYVQSPSRESSHDGDKSTPLYNNSPMDSPSHPSRSSSFGRHSRNSSASRFSGIFRSSSGRKGGGRKHDMRNNDKGWPECDVIMEEGPYDDLGDKGLSRRVQALIALVSFFLLFTVFCLIIWGASRPFKAEITVKSLAMHNFYVGAGSDFSGVATNMLTLNGSLRLSVYNPATIFGIHVSSTPINLVYSEITVATGQLRKYYQPRKSRRSVLVNLEGEKVPLYGAGSNLMYSGEGGVVPLTLNFEIRSLGNVVGKLVRTKHKRQVSCPVVIDSTRTKPIKFNKTSCSYD